MKKAMSMFLAAILLSPLLQVSAFAKENIFFKNVSATVQASTKQAVVSGKVESGPNQLVTLKVVDPAGQYFLDSVKSTDQGQFSFKWNVSVTGEYQVQIGVENSSTPYQTSFKYNKSGDVVTGGGGGASTVTAPERAVQLVSDLVVDKLKGYAAVLVEEGIQEVRIPADKVGQLAQGGAGLSLEGTQFSLNLKAETLKELLAAAAAEGLGNPQIAIRFVETPAKDVESLLAKAEERNGADLRAASVFIDFEVQLIGQDGKSVKVSNFAEPITLQLKVDGTDSNKLNLAGLYFISDQGELEYLGSVQSGDGISGKVKHFSKYAVLDYKKSFIDVTADNWAYHVISEMAAKHIVEGISQTEFAPGRSVTRAEFAALLVRTLGLTGGKASFTDVPADSWYADVVGAAYAAGIVNGSSETSFQPDNTISREEMAAMLVRAWAVSHPNDKAGAGSAVGFEDKATISAWAEEVVGQANGLGLMKGRSDTEFAPQGVTTRAEATQAIANLLNMK